MDRSDQEVLLQPEMPWCCFLGDDRSVRQDIVWNIRAGFLATLNCGNTCGHRPAMDTAGRIAHRCQHGAVKHRLHRRRHGVHATDDDAFAALLLHDLMRGKRHVVIVEEGSGDIGVLCQDRIPDAGDLGHVPVGWLFVDHFHIRDSWQPPA